VLISVGLFYVLARRRVGPLVALAPSILLLFLGYAWEPLIWAFDMHTVYALVFGLGALLALERHDRRGDIAACALLVASVSMIELGLAFVLGAAVSVLAQQDRRRRIWIVSVPVVLYAAWWVWARHFHQSAITFLNIHLFPVDLVDSLAAIAGSLTGLNPTGTVSPQTTTVTAAGTALALMAVVALALRVRWKPVPPTLWVFLTVALAYWLTIALGGREPDSSRYILAGSMLVLLVAADALTGLTLRPLAVAGIFIAVALAIPPNIAKFYDGRRLQLNDASASRAEYAMLELERGRVAPGYVPGSDPAVVEVGGGVAAPLPAGEYFRAANEFGPLGYSLSQVREQAPEFRAAADVTLVDGLGIRLRRLTVHGSPAGCVRIADGSPEQPVYFTSPSGGVQLRSLSNEPVEVRVSRFAKEGAGVSVGRIQPRSRVELRLPPDASAERWRVLVNAPVESCRLLS
jgi:CDP-diglyceride synthetase